MLFVACGSDGGGADDEATEATAAQTEESGGDTTTTAADETGAGPAGTLKIGFAAIGPIQLYPPYDALPGQFIDTTTIYEGLLDFTTEVEPWLVESWTVSEDNLTWTFKLREGIPFQGDWGEMTSDDVIYSLEQHMVDDATNQSGSFFRDDVGFDAGGSMRAIDDYTIEIKTATPSFGLPYTLSGEVQPTVFSKAHIESVGIEEATLNGIGTGPWQWDEGRSDEFFRYRAVENHWRNTPAFEFLEFLEIPETATLVANFQAGQVDAFTIGTFGASPLSFDEIAAVRDVEGAVIETVDNASQIYLDFHGMRNVQDDRGLTPADRPWVSQNADTSSDEWQAAADVRKAMSLAIDRQSIIDNLLLGQGTIPPQWVTGPYDPPPNVDWGEFDPDKARQLLADAGYADGFTIPMALPNVFDGNPNNIGTAICPMWEAELNIVCEIENVAIADFRTMAWVNRGYEGITPHPGTGGVDPVGYTVNSHSRGVLNFSGEHPEQDEIVDRIEDLFTLEDRLQGSYEWQQWIYDNTQVIPVVNTPVFVAFGPNVEPWEFDARDA
ncbi:MAG: ABC transporter substrate-binding protein, partial [Acidimicrobiia bacterium]|nr:ABC transporter substrate-binding protein [Acidimicrobiia bacterium]